MVGIAARLAIGVGIMLPLVASAAAPPSNVLFAGTIAREYLDQGAASWCLFEGTNSTFMSKSAPVRKLISFPDIVISTAAVASDPPTVHGVGGQSVLTFNPNVPDAGLITFIPVAGNPDDVNTAKFRNYTYK